MKKPKAAKAAGTAKAVTGSVSRRPSMIDGEVRSGKDGAQQWIDAGGLNIYSPPTVAAAHRLLKDQRAATCWQRGLGAVEFEEAVHCYELTTARTAWAAWDAKTPRERELWKRRFTATIATMLELMEDGPAPPEVSGFVVSDYVLMELLRLVGHPIPSLVESAAFLQAMGKLNSAVEDLPWTISHALRHYQRQVETNSENSILQVKKPKDAKAGRAKFIVNFRRYSGCAVPVVAAVAAVMFDDDAVDERLVRRLTSARADSRSSRKNPP